jgi:3-oxoacyl-[acyl-carrier-protein] synthase II
MRRRVVITGEGALCALGASAQALWEGLLAGRPGIRRLERLRGQVGPCLGAEVDVLDPALEARDERIARDAIEQALVQATLAPREAAFWWSTGLDTLQAAEPGDTQGSALTLRRSAGACFRRLASDFRRPQRMVAVACASGGQAIGEAFHAIRAGRVDACVAGGSSTMLTPYYVAGFHALGALAGELEGEPPGEACKPFDRRRRGLVLGDGAGALVLESRERALARGARPLAEIVGFGTSQDAFDLNRPPEDGAGAELCIRRALADAGLRPCDVGAVNAHGTATLAGDMAEAAALRRVLGEHTPVHSVKGAIGHAMAAAGALEAIVAARTCASGIVPATLNLDEPDERCAVDLVAEKPRELAVRRVLSTSFGMGGQNAALLLERAEP